MNTPAIFASDLHGNQYAYEKLFRIASERSIRIVILGGDLTPKWPILRFGEEGARIPLDPRILRLDPNGYTYTDFLRRLNAVFQNDTKAAIQHFIRLGGYILDTDETAFFKELMEEQELLRKMLDEFDPKTAFSSARLNFDEWDCVEALLLDGAKDTPNQRELDILLPALRFRTLNDAVKLEILKLKAEFEKMIKRFRRPSVSREIEQFFAYTINAAKPYLETTEDVGMSHIPSLCRNAATKHVLDKWCVESKNLSYAEEPQGEFLREYLRTCVRQYKAAVPDGKVFLILGNDDSRESCERAITALQKQGEIVILHHQVVELDNGLKLVGYSHVPPIKDCYPAWFKPEDEILTDLYELEQRAGSAEKTVFVIHCPPARTKLDQSFESSQHYGSVAVRIWIRESRKRAVLSGHIHEAPFVNGGIWRETLDGTPCFQPGGWHDQDLCAVIFDLENPSDAEWISDPENIRR